MIYKTFVLDAALITIPLTGGVSLLPLLASLLVSGFAEILVNTPSLVLDADAI